MYEMKNLHLRLTSHCNKRCEHCFASLDEEEPELSSCYWLGIIKKAERMAVHSVTLTGGEPLVYHEIDSLLESLQDCKIPIKIETNGILLEKKREKLQKLKSLKKISISPGLHYDNSYMENLMQRLLRIREYGLPIELQATIVLGDIEQKLAWIEKFAQNGIHVRLMLGHNGLGGSRSLPNLHYEQMLTIGNRYAENEMISCELPGLLLGRNASQGCGWNRDRADILPNGKLSPCAAIAWNHPDFVLEYVDGDNLDIIWQTNSFLHKIRHLKQEDFKGHCFDCRQFDTCQSSCVATSIGILGDLLAGYPLCTFAARKQEG